MIRYSFSLEEKLAKHAHQSNLGHSVDRNVDVLAAHGMLRKVNRSSRINERRREMECWRWDNPRQEEDRIDRASFRDLEEIDLHQRRWGSPNRDGDTLLSSYDEDHPLVDSIHRSVKSWHADDIDPLRIAGQVLDRGSSCHHSSLHRDRLREHSDETTSNKSTENEIWNQIGTRSFIWLQKVSKLDFSQVLRIVSLKNRPRYHRFHSVGWGSGLFVVVSFGSFINDCLFMWDRCVGNTAIPPFKVITETTENYQNKVQLIHMITLLDHLPTATGKVITVAYLATMGTMIFQTIAYLEFNKQNQREKERTEKRLNHESCALTQFCVDKMFDSSVREQLSVLFDYCSVNEHVNVSDRSITSQNNGLWLGQQAHGILLSIVKIHGE